MDFAQRWMDEVWNEGKESAIDDMMAPNCQIYGINGADGLKITGREMFKHMHRAFRTAMPNVRLQLEDTLTDGARVAVRYRMTGTHTGPGLPQPISGKTIDVMGMSFLEVHEGRITQVWNSFDSMAMYQQLM